MELAVGSTQAGFYLRNGVWPCHVQKRAIQGKVSAEFFFLWAWLQDCGVGRGFLTCCVMLQRRSEMLLWVVWWHVVPVREEIEKHSGLQQVNKRRTNEALLVVSKAPV